MDTTQKIEMILEWALQKRGKAFDTSTIDGIKDYYDERGEYTSNQETAVDNIFERFFIAKWFENKLKKKCKNKK